MRDTIGAVIVAVVLAAVITWIGLSRQQTGGDVARVATALERIADRLEKGKF
jgi:hypothetical protein